MERFIIFTTVSLIALVSSISYTVDLEKESDLFLNFLNFLKFLGSDLGAPEGQSKFETNSNVIRSNARWSKLERGAECKTISQKGVKGSIKRPNPETLSAEEGVSGDIFWPKNGRVTAAVHNLCCCEVFRQGVRPHITSDCVRV